MKERPILFSGEMVSAILAGRKTQTRRIIEPPSKYQWLNIDVGMMVNFGGYKKYVSDMKYKYGAPGDRLWVREAFAETDLPDGTPVITYAAGGCIAIARKEQRGEDYLIPAYNWQETPIPDRWRPSIHMPRWASRILLEITNVRVQRVQDISEDDMRAEGVRGNAGSYDLGCEGLVEDFADLWDSINEKRGYGWDANPWVRVITFKRIA